MTKSCGPHGTHVWCFSGQEHSGEYHNAGRPSGVDVTPAVPTDAVGCNRLVKVNGVAILLGTDSESYGAACAFGLGEDFQEGVTLPRPPPTKVAARTTNRAQPRAPDSSRRRRSFWRPASANAARSTAAACLQHDNNSFCSVEATGGATSRSVALEDTHTAPAVVRQTANAEEKS